jgi:2',3'-cyclic-nucleotide 2'-phosphodiesterase (5'-nucleotidase family)
MNTAFKVFTPKKNSLFVSIALLLLLSSCWVHQPLRYNYTGNTTTIEINNNTIKDSIEQLSMLTPYRATLDKTMNAIIGETKTELKKAKPNGSLGNLVCDAMLWKAKQIDSTVCLAVANYGGIRIPSIPAGNITLGKVYELMPFENTISIIPVSGAFLDTLCQKIAKAEGMPISGFTMDIDNKKATSILIGNEKLDFSKTYSIAVNSYMAAGGDDCEFFIPMKKNTTNALIRDAILNYIKECNAKNLPLEGKDGKRIR